MLEAFLAGEIFAFMLVFTRIGAAMVLLPGLGDQSVPAQVRLYIALGLTFVITPVVAPSLPPEPTSGLALATLIAGEAIIGAFLGAVPRLIFSALDVAGMMISFQSGFASAFIFNPALQSQSTIIGIFLTLTGGLLLFVTGLHHVAILALIDSYTLFTPGVMPIMGDMANTMSELLADGFRLGFHITAPFFVVMLGMYIAMGLLARLMPQLQIFFLALPLQLFLGVMILSITLAGSMLLFLDVYESVLEGYLRPQ